MITLQARAREGVGGTAHLEAGRTQRSKKRERRRLYGEGRRKYEKPWGKNCKGDAKAARMM